MIENFLEKYHSLFNPSYYALDSGYDVKDIYQSIITDFNITPIIAYNSSGSVAPPEGLDKDLDPVCSESYKLVYWGKTGNYLKFRCPHALGKCNCPHSTNWCSSSNYGYTLKINYKSNPRQLGYPLRSSSEWKKLYHKRTSVEGCNGRLKKYLNLDNIRSKGIQKLRFMHYSTV